MTIAQIAEIGTMLALPWMLSRWGVRKNDAHRDSRLAGALCCVRYR